MKMKKLTALLSAAAMMFGIMPLTMAESVYTYDAATKTFVITDTVVPGDIKVKEAGADDSTYDDSTTVKFTENVRKFDFKATLDMKPVHDKFVAAKEVIELKGKYDDFAKREVKGQFIVTVIPGDYITIPNADITGTTMYGFTTNSDIYEETAPRTVDADGNLIITVDLKDGVTVEKLAEANSLVDIEYKSADVDVRKAGTIKIKGTVTGWIETVPTGAQDEYNAKASFVAEEAGNPVIVATIKSYTSGGLSGGGGGTTTKKVTVTFYDGTVKHLEEKVDITKGSYVYDTSAVSIPEAEGNKIFTGWYKDAACTQPANAKETITKDTNFYAGWSDTKININYNIDGKDVPVNTGATGSVNVGPEDLVITETGVEVKLSGIEAVGVKILGWYLDPEFTTPAGDSYTTTEDITFYAETKEIDTPPVLDAENHFAYIIGYPDGYVRPENFITRQEVATIFFRLLTDEARNANFARTNDFADVMEGMWSNNAISTMANMGIVEGYAGMFKPLDNITRAEFATIAARFADGEAAASPFSDTAGHWAEGYIGIAASLQWVNGSDGMFRPDDYITRAEVMAIVNRVLKRAVESDYILADAVRWEDNSELAWYYEDVIEATNSHNYVRVAPGQVAERWTEITATKDWSALEQ